jgi:hypothetical protein
MRYSGPLVQIEHYTRVCVVGAGIVAVDAMNVTYTQVVLDYSEVVVPCDYAVRLFPPNGRLWLAGPFRPVLPFHHDLPSRQGSRLRLTQRHLRFPSRRVSGASRR